MNNETTADMAERAALEAMGSRAMEGNLQAVAELAGLADQQQTDEHIRGIVATTMEFISSTATTATRAHAAQWRDWALSMTSRIDTSEIPSTL